MIYDPIKCAEITKSAREIFELMRKRLDHLEKIINRREKVKKILK